MKDRKDRFSAAIASHGLVSELEQAENEIARLKEELTQLQTQTAGVQRFPLERIVPLQLRQGLKQPRKYFDPQAMAKLEASIRSLGVQEPLLLRPSHNGLLEVVSGERRWRVSATAGCRDVPGIVKKLSDEKALEVALVANLMRENLNPIEETDSIIGLIILKLALPADEIPSLLIRLKNEHQRNPDGDNSGIITIEQQVQLEQIFIEFGMTLESFVSNRLPLLRLPETILEAIRQGKIEFSKARLIARIPDDGQRQTLLDEAIAFNLTKVQIREKICALKTQPVFHASSKPENLKDNIHSLYNRLRHSPLVWEDPSKQKQLEQVWQVLSELLDSD